jgi:hypothetical protein
MEPMSTIRCPRCLTEGQAPAELERLLCPVCSTVLRRATCSACGQVHVVEESNPAFTCPVTGIQLMVVGGTLQPTSAAAAAPPPPPPAPPPAPSPPAAPRGPTAPAALPPGPQPIGQQPPPPPPPSAPAWDQAVGSPGAPQVPGQEPVADGEGAGRPIPWKVIAIVGLAVAVLVAVLVIVLVSRSNDEADPTTPQGLVIQQLDASDDTARTACTAVHTFAANRATLVQLLDTLPPAGRAALLQSIRTQGGGWLPPEAKHWAFPEIRLGLLTLWDQCQRRGLGP